MIALTDREVFEALCEAFESAHVGRPKERTYDDLSDEDKKDLKLITSKLNNKLALKNSGSA